MLENCAEKLRSRLHNGDTVRCVLAIRI